MYKLGGKSEEADSKYTYTSMQVQIKFCSLYDEIVHNVCGRLKNQ